MSKQVSAEASVRHEMFGSGCCEVDGESLLSALTCALFTFTVCVFLLLVVQ